MIAAERQLYNIDEEWYKVIGLPERYINHDLTVRTVVNFITRKRKGI